MIGGTTGLILSNFGNALQPAVVKLSKLDSYDQTVIRILIFAISCVIITKWFHLSSGWIKASFAPDSIAMNGVNLLSVFSGIRGFAELPVGVGLTVFYTWPLYLTFMSQWERASMKKELTEDNRSRLWMGIFLSFLGLFIMFGPEWFQFFHSGPEWSSTWIGLFWVSVSALTHAFTIFYYHRERPHRDHPAARLGSLTLPTAIAFVILTFWNPGKWALGHSWLGSDDDFRWQVLLLAIFQITIGLGSFLLHFYSIPKLPKEWISSLSFLTLIAGYLFGWFFFGEKLNLRVSIGTLLVFIGIGVVSRALKGEFEEDTQDDTKRFIYDKLKLITMS